MTPLARALLAFAVRLVRSRMPLHLVIAALRYRLRHYHRSRRRPQMRYRPSDRSLWSRLARQ